VIFRPSLPLLLLVVASFTQGCGGLGDHYVVLVDPRFSEDERAQVVSALESWEAAVPVHFSVAIATCAGIEGSTICTHASNSQGIAAAQSVSDGIGLGVTLRETSWGHTVDGGEVFIDVPTIETSYAPSFERIVAHEIGHAMQLEHNAAGNLMAAMATEDAPAPTCTDNSQWYQARGRHDPACQQ
jgi:hypothetical protein